MRRFALALVLLATGCGGGSGGSGNRTDPDPGTYDVVGTWKLDSIQDKTGIAPCPATLPSGRNCKVDFIFTLDKNGLVGYPNSTGHDGYRVEGNQFVWIRTSITQHWTLNGTAGDTLVMTFEPGNSDTYLQWTFHRWKE